MEARRRGSRNSRTTDDATDTAALTKRAFSWKHDRALKRRAGELGVSEAELVRRLLDGLVLEGGGGALAGKGETSALDGFFAEADRTSESHGFPEGYRFDRDGLYEDRGKTGG